MLIEYLEWGDGNPDAEERRAMSVVVAGGKVRLATPDDHDPHGVVVAWPDRDGDNYWSGKYERDALGDVVQAMNPEGSGLCPVINKAFDPEAAYVPRADRPEWAAVALSGRVRLRKGQQSGARWIKLRDVADDVAEWIIK